MPIAQPQYVPRAGNLDATGDGQSLPASRLPPWLAAHAVPTMVNVASYATGGTGTSGDPWTGWDTACPWAADKAFWLQAGYFAHSATLDLTYRGIALIGAGSGARLVYSGSGTAVKIYSTSTDNDVMPFRARIVGGLTIDGGGSAATGLLLQAAHDSVLDVRVINVTGIKVDLQWVVRCVGSVDLRGNTDETVHAQYGLVIDADGHGYQETCAYLNVANGECSVAGIDIRAAGYNVITGFSELCSGIGVRTGAASFCNIFFGVDGEVNAGGDFEIAGLSNSLIGCNSSSVATLKAGGINNSIRGGRYRSITAEAGAINASVEDCTYGSLAEGLTGGVVTNHAGTQARIRNVCTEDGLTAYAGPGTDTRSVRDLIRSLAPALYWRMGDRSGSSMITDSSGNGQAGTIDTTIGSMTLGSSALTYRDAVTHAAFAGGAYVKVAAPSGVAGSSTLTVGAFVKSSDAANYQHIFTRDDNSTQRQVIFRLSNTGKAQAIIFIGGTPYTATGATTVADGKPHFIAATYDGAALRIYVDGVADGSQSATGTIATVTGQAVSGASNDVNFGTLYPFTGTLGEVFASYTVAASAGDLLAIAQSGLTP